MLSEPIGQGGLVVLKHQRHDTVVWLLQFHQLSGKSLSVINTQRAVVNLADTDRPLPEGLDFQKVRDEWQQPRVEALAKVHWKLDFGYFRPLLLGKIFGWRKAAGFSSPKRLGKFKRLRHVMRSMPKSRLKVLGIWALLKYYFLFLGFFVHLPTLPSSLRTTALPPPSSPESNSKDP